MLMEWSLVLLVYWHTEEDPLSLAQHVSSPEQQHSVPAYI
jgi:hypothetical protein